MRKNKFQLDCIVTPFEDKSASIEVIGYKPNYMPYVSIQFGSIQNRISGCIKDKDLERFAIKIPKSLNSKRLNVKKNK